MLGESGEAAVGVCGSSVLCVGEPSLGQWRWLRLWCSSSSSAGRGIPSSWLRDRASNQSSSFWKGGLREEEEGREDTQRGLRLKPDWRAWEKTWGSNQAAEACPWAGRLRCHLKVVVPPSPSTVSVRMGHCVSEWALPCFLCNHISERWHYYYNTCPKMFATQLLHLSWWL